MRGDPERHNPTFPPSPSVTLRQRLQSPAHSRCQDDRENDVLQMIDAGITQPKTLASRRCLRGPQKNPWRRSTLVKSRTPQRRSSDLLEDALVPRTRRGFCGARSFFRHRTLVIEGLRLFCRLNRSLTLLTHLMPPVVSSRLRATAPSWGGGGSNQSLRPIPVPLCRELTTPKKGILDHHCALGVSTKDLIKSRCFALKGASCRIRRR